MAFSFGLFPVRIPCASLVSQRHRAVACDWETSVLVSSAWTPAQTSSQLGFDKLYAKPSSRENEESLCFSLIVLDATFPPSAQIATISRTDRFTTQNRMICEISLGFAAAAQWNRWPAWLRAAVDPRCSWSPLLCRSWSDTDWPQRICRVSLLSAKCLRPIPVAIPTRPYKSVHRQLPPGMSTAPCSATHLTMLPDARAIIFGGSFCARKYGCPPPWSRTSTEVFSVS